jgi:hypothetical protein
MNRTLKVLQKILLAEDEKIPEPVISTEKSLVVLPVTSIFSHFVGFFRKIRADHMIVIYNIMINITIDGNIKEGEVQRYKVYFQLCDGYNRLFKLFEEGLLHPLESVVNYVYPLLHSDVALESLPTFVSPTAYTSPSCAFFCCRVLSRLYCYQEVPKKHCSIMSYMFRVVKVREVGMFDPGETQKTMESYIEKFGCIFSVSLFIFKGVEFH